MEGKTVITDTNVVNEDNLDSYLGLYKMLTLEGNKNYYITSTVIDRLELFDTKKCMIAEGWKVFKTLPDFKKTYILPDPDANYAKYGGSGCLRVVKSDGYLQFFHLTFKYLPKDQRTPTIEGTMYWVLLWVDLEKGVMADHWKSRDGQSLAGFLYSLMCFVELCDNQVIEVAPKAKYGTRKEGKVINILPFPLTVINNTWNVITVRTEGFPVKGHAALRWTGPSRSIPKIVYIQPFQKQGYTRKSGKELSQ